MALNVVPLLFVALPFVLTMDAMYDLYQDFALPSDRRGWGHTEDVAKENRIKRAHIKYFRGVLAHQRKAFKKWQNDQSVPGNWDRSLKKYIEDLEKVANKNSDNQTDRNNAVTARSNLREIRKSSVREFGIIPDSLKVVLGATIPEFQGWKPSGLLLNPKVITDFNKDEDNEDVRLGSSGSVKEMLNSHENYNELNAFLNEMNKPIKAESGEAFTVTDVKTAINGLAFFQNMIEARAGDHSGVFKWVVYNEDPSKGEHNMLAWNYPTLLLAGVLINMLGEYYAKFSPVVSGPQAKNLCDILDSVLIVHVAIVGIQLLASLYFNLNANKNPNARNPSLDLMDIHNHPEDFASSVLIGLFNHLGTAVLVHTFVRASFGHSLRTSGVSMSSFSRGSRRSSRRSRRSSRRRRR